MAENENTLDVPAKDTRRSLKDLFMVGQLETLTDGSDEVTVYIQKLTTAKIEECYKAANKSKSTVKALIKEYDKKKDLGEEVQFSEDLGFYIEEVDEFLETRDDFINYLISKDEDEARQSKEAEIAANDEWSKEGYLEGLQDSWHEGLKEIYLTEDEGSEEYEKAKVVLDELARFQALVEVEMKDVRNELIYDLQDLTDETLREKAYKQYIKDVAEGEFIKTFLMHQVYHAVRDPENRSEYIFSSPEDVYELTPETFAILQNAIQKITVPSTEGKD